MSASRAAVVSKTTSTAKVMWPSRATNGASPRNSVPIISPSSASVAPCATSVNTAATKTLAKRLERASRPHAATTNSATTIPPTTCSASAPVCGVSVHARAISIPAAQPSVAAPAIPAAVRLGTLRRYQDVVRRQWVGVTGVAGVIVASPFATAVPYEVAQMTA
jgi:hypothetical protein